MIQRPDDVSAFEFAVVSGLRAAQLMRGCIQRIEGSHKATTAAQLEVAGGYVSRVPAAEQTAANAAARQLP